MPRSNLFITATRGEHPDDIEVLTELDLTIKSIIKTSWEVLTCQELEGQNELHETALNAIWAAIERWEQINRHFGIE